MIDEQIVAVGPGPPAGGVERALVVTVDVTSGVGDRDRLAQSSCRAS